ncbi:MAG: DUF2252 family protein [Polyangiales bacterium]
MKPLAAADFAGAALARADARASVPELSDDAFEARWKLAAAEGALKVVRSFPALWWRDLRAVDPARVPAGRALGFGDAHVENFGFLAFDDGGVGYAFNDLDDSGDVEVALDALRYFTAASLWRGAGAPVDLAALVRTWADALEKDRDPVIDDRAFLDAVDAPDPAKMRRKALERWSTEPELPPITDVEHAALRDALRGLPETGGYEFFAARRRAVHGGGSGGLLRFWAIVRAPGGHLDVLELKERSTPATEQGARARKVDKRLSTLKKAVWPGRSITPYHRLEVRLAGRDVSFVVRSRGARASLKGDVPAPFRKQARALAAVHRRAERAASPGELAAWVEGSVPALVARWSALARVR